MNWDLSNLDVWITPGLSDKILVLSALPAFVLGLFAAAGLGKLVGVSQVSTFMFLMPALIFTWYYLVGWLLERWIRKRWHPTVPVPD